MNFLDLFKEVFRDLITAIVMAFMMFSKVIVSQPSAKSMNQQSSQLDDCPSNPTTTPPRKYNSLPVLKPASARHQRQLSRGNTSFPYAETVPTPPHSGGLSAVCQSAETPQGNNPDNHLGESQEYDLRQLLEHVMDEACTKKSHMICSSLILDPLLPRKVYGDPKELQDLLKELISNSKVLLCMGSISMTANVLSLDRYCAFVKIVINDNGFGCLPSHVKSVMDESDQQAISTDYINRYKNCKRIVEINGGTFSLRSGRGCGTTVEITLRFSTRQMRSLRPFSPSSMLLEPQQLQSCEQDNMKSLRMLIFDPRSLRLGVKELLESALCVNDGLGSMNISIDLTDSFSEAYEFCCKNHYDVVFCMLGRTLRDVECLVQTIRAHDKRRQEQTYICVLNSEEDPIPVQHLTNVDDYRCADSEEVFLEVLHAYACSKDRCDVITAESSA